MDRERSVPRVLIVAIMVAAVVTSAAGGYLAGVLVERAMSDALPEAVTPKGMPGVDGHPAADTSVDDLVDRVVALMSAKALHPVSEASMTTGALSGLIGSLEDSHSTYLDPKAREADKEMAEGDFDGIGVVVQIDAKTKTPIVLQVYDGTPAKGAGLKAGDHIVGVDGKATKGWVIDKVVKHIRGTRGTIVRLRIQRKGKADFERKVTRAEVVIPNVVSRMIGRDIGYIRMFVFNTHSAAQVQAAIKKLEKRGAKGFIFDLRENGGGVLDSAIDISSLFVKDGVLVRIRERGKPEELLRATGNMATTKPLVVLVDRYSASASELTAVALQDYGRATIVGEKTFGKGSVQQSFPLDNGGAVTFTIAEYLSPKKRVIDRHGVTPDVVVVMDPLKQMKRATDAQLLRAIKELRKRF